MDLKCRLHHIVDVSVVFDFVFRFLYIYFFCKTKTRLKHKEDVMFPYEHMQINSLISLYH